MTATVTGPRSPWVAAATAGSITLAAAAAQVGRPLWRDEVVTVLVAARPLGDLLRLLAGAEANMGGYYLALHAWIAVVGSSAVSVQAFSALGAALGAGATAWLAGIVLGRRAALPAGLVAGGALVAVGMAVEARAYPWVVACSALASIALVRLVGAARPVGPGAGADRDARRAAVAYGLAVAAGCAAHVLMALVVAGHLVAVAAASPDRRLRRLLAGGLGLGSLGLLPSLPALVARRSTQASWIPPLGADTVGAVLTPFGPWVAVAVAGVGGWVLGAGLLRWRPAGDPPPGAGARFPRALVVAGVLVPPLALAAVSVLAQPLFTPRYLAGALPLVAVTAVAGVMTLGPTRRRVAGVLLVAVVGLVLVVRGTDPTPIEDLGRAAATIAAGTRPGDVVLYVPSYARLGVHDALERRGGPAPADVALGRWVPDALYPEERSAGEVAAAVAPTQRIWVVGYPDSTWSPTEGEPGREALRLLEPGRRTVAVWRFGELELRLLDARSVAPEPVG